MTGEELPVTCPVTRAGETGEDSWRLFPGLGDDGLGDDSLDAHFLECVLCASGDDACPEGERLMAAEMGLDD